MAGLTSKLVSQTEVNSGPDVFFEIFAHKPYELANEAPDIFKSVDLLDGVWGALGSTISGTYVEDGITKIAKALVLAIDEVNKSITYQVIGGDLMDLFTTFTVTFEAGTQDGKNFGTFTFEYLKLLPTTPDPTSLMNLAVAAVKEIDAQATLK